MALMDTGNRLVWQTLKLYLPAGTRLTSVYRPAQSQLDFIARKARKHGYKFRSKPVLADKSSWKEALEFVRSKGYKVSPPGKSFHQIGLAYDFTGPSLEKIETAIRRAVSDGRIILLKGSKSSLLIEEQNRCVHVEIESAIVEYEPFDFA